MKVMSKISSVFALSLLVSLPVSADFSFIPSFTKENVAKTAVVVALGAGAWQLYTQKALSEAELKKRRAVTDETDALTMCRRVWEEVVVGQMEKEKELVAIENGKAVYAKYPATGMVGMTAKVTKKYALPMASCLVVIRETTQKFVDGCNTWNAELANLVRSVVAYMPEMLQPVKK